MDLPVGSTVRVNAGPQRGALGTLLGYADQARLAYVRIVLSASRSALLVVRADAISPARKRSGPEPQRDASAPGRVLARIAALGHGAG